MVAMSARAFDSSRSILSAGMTDTVVVDIVGIIPPRLRGSLFAGRWRFSGDATDSTACPDHDRRPGTSLNAGRTIGCTARRSAIGMPQSRGRGDAARWKGAGSSSNYRYWSEDAEVGLSVTFQAPAGERTAHRIRYEASCTFRS